jgi:hypothetical protein
VAVPETTRVVARVVEAEPDALVDELGTTLAVGALAKSSVDW